MNKSNIIFIRLLTISLLLTPLISLAAEIRGDKQVIVSSNETINDDLYAGGGQVSISGKINGDLVAGGGNVFVNSNIQSDAILGGGNVTVLGNIGDDLRVGGGSVLVQAAVGDDLFAGGGQINLEGPKIGGDLFAGGGVIRVNTPVEGNANLGGREIYINSEIKGNVEVRADKLTLGSKAIINGNLKYSSPKPAVMEQGSVVRGKIDFSERAKNIKRNAFFAAGIIQFLTLLFGALIFGLIFRRYSTELVREALSKPFLEIGRGLILLILMPIISVLLLITIIGIPLGIFGILSFILLLIYSVFSTPVILGGLLMRLIWKEMDYTVDWKSILLGAVVMVILGFIPVLGWLIQFVFVLMTLGTTLRLKWSFLKEWR